MLEELADESGIVERSNHDLALAAGCTDPAIVRRLSLLELAGAIRREHPAADHARSQPARYGHGLPMRRIHLVGRPRPTTGKPPPPEEAQELPEFVDELASDGRPRDAAAGGIVAVLAFCGPCTREELHLLAAASNDAHGFVVLRRLG